ncbi:MAG: DUF1080 domain-containing protein [Saprospiraceae bacterium]|nr:DUF1080 domain-containing protein [Saprospiraceae bacterium]
MKRSATILRVLFIMLGMAGVLSSGRAQEHWPADYRVQRWLDRLPAGDSHQLEGMLKEFFSFGSENVEALLSKHLVTATEVTTPMVYAITSIDRYIGQPGKEVERSLWINGLVNHWSAIRSEPVRRYLLQEMQFIEDTRLAPVILEGLSRNILHDDALLALKDYPDKKLQKVIKKGLKKADRALWTWVAVHPETKWHGLLWKVANRADGADQAFYLKVLALQGNPKDSVLMSNYSSTHPDVVRTYLENCNGNVLPLQTTNALIRAQANSSTCSGLHLLVQHQPRNAIRSHTEELVSGPCSKDLQADLIGVADKDLDPFIQQQMIRDSSSLVRQKYWLEVLSRRGGFSNARFLRQMTATPNESLRTDALIAWSRLAGAESMPYLTDWFFNTRDSARQEMVWPLICRYTDGGNMKSLADRMASLTPHFRMMLLDLIGERRAGICFSQVYYQTQQTQPVLARTAWETLARITEPQHDGLVRSLIHEAPRDLQFVVASGLLNDLHSRPQIRVNRAFLDTTLDDSIRLPLYTQYATGSYDEEVIKMLERTPSFTSANLVEQLLSREDEAAMKILLWIAGHHETMRTQVIEKAVPQIRRRVDGPESQRLTLADWLEACQSQHERDVVFQQLAQLPGWSTLLTLLDYANSDNIHSLVYARSLAQVCLPAPDQDGLTGSMVTTILEKIIPTLEPVDAELATRIEMYVKEMPESGSYESIFNGVDLTGWQGWVADPHTLRQLTTLEKQARQQEADIRMRQHWNVKDGTIQFSGEGANLVTKKTYQDFELQLDWRITKDGDSGIYLRGYPQVQIWDTSRVEVGAQVGSGGLYNNQKGFSTPLVVADRPVGSWNHFNIRMVGDRVTVYLNDRLVVHNVSLENYWDRNLPILAEGPIELQAHGTDLAFRNLIVKELTPETYGLSREEIKDGFVPLFNGKNLDNWLGNTTDYQVKDEVIDVDPSRGGEGNLYTVDTFSNFALRFEFQLTAGANNGIGIHTPLTGDAAYVGKEIQVLENTDTIYNHLQPYQYHGSVYGVIPARQGKLKAVGQWNEEEIRIDGDHIRVTVNGEVITEGSLQEWTRYGTMDHKDHPGLQRHQGHIGFLGHGSPLKFRNVRILRL